MNKIGLTILLCLAIALNISAQSGYRLEEIKLNPQSIIKEVASKNRSGKTVSLDLPYLDGAYMTFEAIEANIMCASMRAKYPDIHSYDVVAKDNPNIRGKLTLTKDKFNVTLLTPNGLTSIHSKTGSKEVYIIEQGISPDDRGLLSGCAVTDDHSTTKTPSTQSSENKSKTVLSNGSFVRRYRLAIVTTGEFYRSNGNNDEDVVAAVVFSVDGIEAIFSTDLGIRFELLDPFLYNDPSSDPFSPGGERTNQASSAISAVFGSNEYDFGHVFHNHNPLNGWDSGGVAGLGVVCGPFKARGWSGSFSNEDTGWIQLAAHEFGHMFGCPHTFNGDGGSCSDNISKSTSYEIGSGTTIMSYNGICGAGQNIPYSGSLDSYFHANSLISAIEFINAGGRCAMQEETGNHPPDISADRCGQVYTVPKNTSFLLSGQASDQDGDRLTFNWEQYDQSASTQGLIGSQAAANANAPIFRSFPPSDSPIRYFPEMQNILNGTDDPFNVLSSVARTMNFKFVVRDNHIGGGGVSIDDLQVKVSSNGPLILTSPNGSESWQAGEMNTITWDMNGTAALCDSVDLLLTFDDGLTFTTIASRISYSAEQAEIMLSEGLSASNNARLMIKCSDSDCVQFFDISDNKFNLASGCLAEESILCPADSLEYDFESAELVGLIKPFKGQPTRSISVTATNETPRTTITIYDEAGLNCKQTITYPTEIVRFIVEETGEYSFFLSSGFSSTPFISIFDAQIYDTGELCEAFITSSARQNGTGGGVSPSLSTSAQLDRCKEYVIAFYNYGSLPVTSTIRSITGPGFAYRSDIEQSEVAEHDYTYIVVNDTTGVIDLITTVSDFSQLLPDAYTIYGISHKSSGASPPSIIDPSDWVGQELEDVLPENLCLRLSKNGVPLKINTTCRINSISVGGQTSCSTEKNTFDQEIVVDYTLPPRQGRLMVNGQIFDITSSPQTILLTNLPADGNPSVDISVEFTEDNQCQRVFPNAFAAPSNCCPFSVDLGDNIEVCADQEVTLSVNNEESTFQWFRNGELLPETSNTITADLTGTYSILVANSTGCKKPDAVSVVIHPLPTLALGDDQILCDGQTLNLDANTDQSQIEWSKDGSIITDQNNPILDITQTAMYTAKAETEYGCITRDTIDILFNPSPVVDIGDFEGLCQGEQVELEAGMDGIQYQWFVNNNPSETSIKLIAKNTGNYRVEVTNEYDCTTMDETFMVFNPLPLLNIGQDASICDDEEYLFDADTDVTSLTWYFNDQEDQSNTETEWLVTEQGTYEALAVNVFGCELRDTATLTVKEVPIVDIGMDTTLCGNDIIMLNAGADGVSYQWQRNEKDIAGNQTIIPKESGQYNVEVTNALGCTTSDTVEILFRPIPAVDAGFNPTLCFGESHTVSVVTDAATIAWYQNGELIPEFMGLEYDVTNTAEIVVVGTNEFECSTRDTVEVTVNPLPTVALGEDRNECLGSTIQLDVTNPNSTYLWYRDEMPLFSQQNPQINITTTGNYLVEITNEFDCKVSDDVNITFYDLPRAFIPQEEIVLCLGQEYAISTLIQADSFQWSRDGIDIVEDETLDLIQGGLYVLTAYNAIGCAVTDTLLVTESDVPVLAELEDINACRGDAVVVNAGSNDYTYRWTRNGIRLSNTSNTITIGLDGIYGVEAFNQAGCSTSAELTVTFFNKPTVSLGADRNLCIGDELLIVPQLSGSDFYWTKDGEPFAPGSEESAITVTEGGTYLLTVGNSGGCEVSDEIIITTSEKPVIDFPEDQSLCEGDPIALNAGSSTNSYIWYRDNNRLSNTSNILNIALNGEYRVVVTDPVGCSSEDTVVINFINKPSVKLGEDQILCLGDQLTIEADITADEFIWTKNGEVFNSNSTALTLTGGGTFVLTGSNSIGCSVSDTLVIKESEYPMIANFQDQEICGDGPIMLDTESEGYIYTWYRNNSPITSSNSKIQINQSGNYRVEVANVEGCQSETSAQITFFENPIIELEEDKVLCLGDEIPIQVSLFSASGYEWTLNENLFNTNSPNIIVNKGGDYVIRAFNSLGCSTYDTIVISESTKPQLDLDTEILACIGAPFSLNIGSIDHSYSWTLDGQALSNMGPTIDIDKSGLLEVTATNEQGCTSFAQTDITFVQGPQLSLGADVELCQGTPHIITAQTNGSNIQWTKDGVALQASTNTLSVTEFGEYQATVMGSTGCQISDKVKVEFKPLPIIELDNQYAICAGMSAQLTAGSSQNTYRWLRNGQTIGTSSNITISEQGNYSVEASTDFGCKATKDFTVSAESLPQLSVLASAELCTGSTIDLTATSDAPSVSWTLNGNTVNANSKKITISTPGLYIIEAISAKNCKTTIQQSIIERDLPIITLTDQVNLCPDESVTFDIGNHETVKWSNGETTSKISVNSTNPLSDQSTTLSVEAFNQYGCSSSDQVIVNYLKIVQAKIEAAKNKICEGQTLMMTGSGGTSFQWIDPNNSLSSTNQLTVTAMPLSSTIYQFIVNNPECTNNRDTASFELQVSSGQDVFIIPDTCMVLGQRFELEASGGTAYKWEGDAFLSSKQISNPIVSPKENTTYTVFITDSSGCEYIESVELCVIDDPFDIFKAVTVMTPNGDGKNDLLIFKGLEAFPDNRLTVFNRWGNTVFEASGYQIKGDAWDGTYDGEVLPAGTYFYVLTFGEFEVKNSLTILRN